MIYHYFQSSDFIRFVICVIVQALNSMARFKQAQWRNCIHNSEGLTSRYKRSCATSFPLPGAFPLTLARLNFLGLTFTVTLASTLR